MKKIIFLLTLTMVMIMSGCGVISNLISGVTGDLDNAVMEEAMAEVKSDVYNYDGVVPDIEAEVLYHSEENYLILTKWTGDGILNGSCVCYIRADSPNNIWFVNKTTAMDYNASYDIEEMKVLFKIQ